MLARSSQLSLTSDSDSNTSSFVIQTVALQQVSDQRLGSRLIFLIWRVLFSGIHFSTPLIRGLLCTVLSVVLHPSITEHVTGTKRFKS